MGAPSDQGFRLEQTFFVFKPEDRVWMHENIFNLIWHGDGRWNWTDIYHMPIFLRKYWSKHVNRILSERQAEQEAALEAARNRGKSRGGKSTR